MEKIETKIQKTNDKSIKSKEPKTKKATKSKKTKSFFEYKGKPLVRCGNTIYYGNMNDRYIVKIESKETKSFSNLNISTLMSVAMIDTDSEDSTAKKIVKISEKNGLYESLDIANIWLERALAK